MTTDVRFILNRAYRTLINRGVDERMGWMKELRTMVQLHTHASPRIQQLEKERALCLKTVKQLQESVDTLRRVNRSYGARIFDTDKAISEAMEYIGPLPPTEEMEEAYGILDKVMQDSSHKLEWVDNEER
jgi:hypothetical protein